jgi:hypothetical protein
MTQKHTHTITLPFVKFASYSLFLLRSKTRHDRFGRTSSCVCFFFFLLLLFLSLPLPFSLTIPPFLVLLRCCCCYPWTRCRRRHSSYSSNLHSNSRQSAADFKTASTKTLSIISLSLPCFPTKKKRKKYRKRHPNFFPSLVQSPYAFSFQNFAVTIVHQSAAWNARSLELRRYVVLPSSRPLERGCLFAGRENRGWKKKPRVVKSKKSTKKT